MKNLFVFILISALFLSCSMDMQNNCDSWDYPVKPGMEAWKQFQTHDEMVAACRIPENVLFCLSTERLTDLCWQYPLLLDIFAVNFLDDGLDYLFISFNGINELYKRTYVAECLIKRYMEKIESLPFLETENGHFQISIFKLDALLSRVERKETLKDVLQALVIGYEVISKWKFNNKCLLDYNYFARAHVIIKMCEECLGLSNSIFTSFGPAPEYLDIIDKLSYQLIK